jgi:transposase
MGVEKGGKIGKKGEEEGMGKKPQVMVPLDIEDVKVIGTEITKQGEIIITVESTKGGVRCRKCGRRITKLHGMDRWVKIRYLAVFGKVTYLRYRPKRYQCELCEGKPTTTEEVEWHEGNSPMAVVYEEHILLQLVNGTIEDVRRKEGIGYDQVLGVLERRIRGEVEWGRYSRLEEIGVDEIALKKGQRDYVTIVTGRLGKGRMVILGVLSGREKEEVAEFLRFIPQRLQKTVIRVCCDMYEGYIGAVRQELPGEVEVVIDRFHVAKHYREGVDELRKQESKRLKKELGEEEYKLLKGQLWAFRKKPSDLKAEERRVLKQLFSHAPNLKRAYDLREQLTAIFEQKISKELAKNKIKAWRKRVENSGLKCFDKFLTTLENWWEEICNFFPLRANSGFVEGFNNRLKVLKRRCYGLYNLKHLFQRIYLDLEGYRLFAP